MAIALNDFDSIEQCPQDEENPFAQISRALIRDSSISPECRWLIIYLLANKDGWRVQVQQVVNHLKGMVGRDKVYKIFEEAIEAGYIQRIETLVLGKKRYKYRVSRSPKFKKCLLFPDFQETEIQDTENQDAKGKASLKLEHIKDPPLLVPLPPPIVDPLSEWKKKKISLGYKEEDLRDSAKKLAERPQNSINDVERYLDKVLSSIILKKAIYDSPEYKPPKVADKVEDATYVKFAKERDNERAKWERSNQIESVNRIRAQTLEDRSGIDSSHPIYVVEERGVRLFGKEWPEFGWLLNYRNEEFDQMLEGHLQKYAFQD